MEKEEKNEPETALAKAIRLGRESWEAEHGKCSLCAAGDIAAKDGYHYGPRGLGGKCGNVETPD